MCIATKIIKPHDCLIGIAIPMTKKSRRKNLDAGGNKDFSKRIEWMLYKDDTILPFESLKLTMKALQVGLKEEFSFSDLQNFFKSETYKVLILVAHWVDDKVEFFDDFYSSADILHVFPKEKRVIVDLNICTCLRLAETLGINRVNSIIKHSSLNMPSYAGAWFLFYNFFFKLLSVKELIYTDALAMTADWYKNIFNENQ